MKIAIFGLGKIGKNVLENIPNAIGIDIDDKLMSQCDVYIICVYTPEQVTDVINSIDYSNNPLVCIESTITLNILDELKTKVVEENNSNLVICPHRYFEGDERYGIFNQTRVIGGCTDKCLARGFDFYQKYMDSRNIITTDIKTAILSKFVENSYRFVEIAIAEELKLLCDEKEIDFEELRRCVNTKWNIDIKEAREGIKGKCLQKDLRFFNDYFSDNVLFKKALEINEKYVE